MGNRIIIISMVLTLIALPARAGILGVTSVCAPWGVTTAQNQAKYNACIASGGIPEVLRKPAPTNALSDTIETSKAICPVDIKCHPHK